MARILVTLPGGFAILLAATTAFAHHSFAMFDAKQCRQISGEVRAFEWNYPHTWLWLNSSDPKSKGGVTVWGFEGYSPGDLNRALGWQKSWIKTGDKMTVWFNPLRNGKNGGQVSSLTFADGRHLDVSFGGKPCPAKTSGG